MMWLLKYEWLKSDLWTGTYIGAGFEQKLFFLPLYVLCTIDLDLTVYPNDPDEPYATFII